MHLGRYWLLLGGEVRQRVRGEDFIAALSRAFSDTKTIGRRGSNINQ